MLWETGSWDSSPLVGVRLAPSRQEDLRWTDYLMGDARMANTVGFGDNRARDRTLLYEAGEWRLVPMHV